MLTVEARQQIIEKFKRSPNDTGSTEVQVALLSANIDSLGQHFKTHRKDFHSRRGLLHMVNQTKITLFLIQKAL